MPMGHQFAARGHEGLNQAVCVPIWILAARTNVHADAVIMGFQRLPGEFPGDARIVPGVYWFRRGYRSSAGHAEALVLVKPEQSQT